MKEQRWELPLGGRTLEITTGFLAQQASGSAKVRYGDTVVLATAVMSKDASRVTGYFPLMVDFEERYYAAGKIKGSRFIKREGRPSDEAVLAGRAVDRTIRPLFNHRMRNDVQVIATALCYDQENDTGTVAMIGASAALALSDIPWNGPIGAVHVGYVDGTYVLNPSNEERAKSSLDLLVSGTKDKLNMIEAGAEQVSEEILVGAIEFGLQSIKQIAEFIEMIRTEAGREKALPALLAAPADVEAAIAGQFRFYKLNEALYLPNKKEVALRIETIQSEVKAYIEKTWPEEAGSYKEVAKEIFEEVSDAIVHENILKSEKRPDGRKLTQIRPLDAVVGVLPRTHGSAVFTRGETQVLNVTTLGAPGDEQIIETMETDTKKRYIHHYNFPPYSVGEVRPMRGPGRREVGHGALAEKALMPVLPTKEEFPYTMLLVSETLASNGSSSMASTCGSTLSLMDAGVPIKAPVSGIAMGIIVGDEAHYKVLTDIQGLEDHYGDMDFKSAGTAAGVTAIQMDVKLDGVTVNMVRDVLMQAKDARAEILETMLAAIPAPRPELSTYAPRIITLHINPEKIRDVIGPGGKMINQIIDETGVSIDIEDDGSVFITSSNADGAKKAVEWIRNITRSVQAGEVFQGRVTRLMNFGAFAEVLPNQEGLIHISELADYRVERVEDIVKVGDIVTVKVKAIDDQGRINLTMKGLQKQEGC